MASPLNAEAPTEFVAFAHTWYVVELVSPAITAVTVPDAGATVLARVADAESAPVP